MTHMKDLIGITSIRVVSTFASNTMMSQVFISNDFAEIVRTVLERNPEATFKQIDIMPVMEPIRNPAGFVG